MADITLEDFVEKTRRLLELERVAEVRPRGLHSSTFRLNVSAFCGIGGVCRGCSRGV